MANSGTSPANTRPESKPERRAETPDKLPPEGKQIPVQLFVYIFWLHFLFTFFVYIFCLHFFTDPEETTAKKKIVLNLRRTQSTENLQTKEFSEATEAELEMSKMDSNLDIAKQSTVEEIQPPVDEIRKTEPSPTVTVDPAAPSPSKKSSEVKILFN